MSRLYTVAGALLVLAGVAALVLQAWALGAVLLIFGLLGLFAELRTRRTHGRVPLQGGPDAGLERAKAQGSQNVQTTVPVGVAGGPGF